MQICINEKRIRRIIADGDDGKVIEYIINDGQIDDVKIHNEPSAPKDVPKEKSVLEKKMDMLMETKQYKKIQKLMELVKEGYLDYITHSAIVKKTLKGTPKEVLDKLKPENDIECEAPLSDYWEAMKGKKMRNEESIMAQLKELMPEREDIDDYNERADEKTKLSESVPCPLDQLTDEDIERMRETARELDSRDPMMKSLSEEFRQFSDAEPDKEETADGDGQRE